MTDNSFDVWRHGKYLIVSNSFGRPFAEYEWIDGEGWHWCGNLDDLPAVAVKLIPETDAPGKWQAKAERDRLVDDAESFAISSLPQRMRAAAHVLEEASLRSHTDADHAAGLAWDAQDLRIVADRWEVEDREQAETEQRVDEVAQRIFRGDDDMCLDQAFDELPENRRAIYCAMARHLLARYDMTPKAVGE